MDEKKIHYAWVVILHGVFVTIGHTVSVECPTLSFFRP